MTYNQRSESAEGLLCVANFPTNTGYAWHFIESLYAGVADCLAERGIVTWVAYPSMPAPPASLSESAASAVHLPLRFGAPEPMRRLMGFIRENNIRAIYLADRAPWHPAFVALRHAGVRKIVVHDHTSGQRTRPRGLKRAVKYLTRRLPGTLADEVIGVSDFVARRKIDVDLVPPDRVKRIWNTLPPASTDPNAAERIRSRYGVPQECPIVACACRAAPEKGLGHLLRAFDRLIPIGRSDGNRPMLLYMGDGPALQTLEALREQLAAKQHIIFTGYQENAADVLGGADICVVPSVWHEAFGLAALEPMARGVPVIATRVGGIPEVVIDGETGLLVPPADEAALTGALRQLLSHAEERRRLGRNGKRRVQRHFSRSAQLRQLTSILEGGFTCARE